VGASPGSDRIISQPVTASVRILVAGAAAAERDRLGTRAALARLGPAARIEVEADPLRAAERCRIGPVDLVVAEHSRSASAHRLLEILGGAGPPVVVVCPGGDAEALEAFRLGAADCVVPGRASPLAEVALEQLGRWRRRRERASLQELQRDLLQKEKMASIGQLAAGVAHEINNPIGFVHANLAQMAEYVSDLRRVWLSVEALQKATASGDGEAARRAAGELATASDEVDVAFVLADLAKAIRESMEGSERVRHIVQDLKEFSRRDSGEAADADVNACLESTLQIVWPMMKHLVTLEKRYAELPPVRCYPMLLKQVLLNLLVNAHQAIEERVGDGNGTGRIRLETRREGAQVVIAVCDDGVGIRPEHRERIFDPFFTTKRVGAGTGLGLSISYQIIERHGGTLTARSEPEAGTTFEVRLPLAPAG